MSNYPVSAWGSGLLARAEQAWSDRAYTIVERSTMLRLAEVRADGMIVRQQAKEIDALAQVAMAGQAELHAVRNALSRGDPRLDAELAMFTELAGMGKAHVLGSTVDHFTGRFRR
jgi:hypothetical protein